MTAVIHLEDGSWIGSSQPILEQREKSDFSQGEPLSGPKDGQENNSQSKCLEVGSCLCGRVNSW